MHNFHQNVSIFGFLTCALRAQNSIFHIFYIEKIIFETFKTLNAQFPKKTSTFNSLIYATKTQVSISLCIYQMF